MASSSSQVVLSCVFILLLVTCSVSDGLVVKHQIAGLDTNCYLVYDKQSKDAAIIDVGGSIDTLLDHISAHDLRPRYFLFTHGHFDHVVGLPAIRDRYPQARVCITQSDYDDMQVFLAWALENKDSSFLEIVRKGEKTRILLEFDASTFGHPDVYLEDDQIYKLGEYEIRLIHSPGHSPGSMCFSVKDMLFSGDVLMRGTVGGTDELNSSREAQIRSVRRLYELLPDHTKVYPGHGEFTDIGTEKRENKRVSVDGDEWGQE